MTDPLENDYCRSCLRFFTSHLFKCDSRDHYLCSDCHQKINRCPECKIERKRRIAHQITKRIVRGERPCRNYPLGCPKILAYRERIEHEKLCDYEPFVCPCLCTKRSSFKTLHIEFDNNFADAIGNVEYVIRDEEEKRFVLRYQQHLFVVHTKSFRFGNSLCLNVTCYLLNNLREHKINGSVPFTCFMTYEKYGKWTDRRIAINNIGHKKRTFVEQMFYFQMDPTYCQYVLNFYIENLK